MAISEMDATDIEFEPGPDIEYQQEPEPIGAELDESAYKEFLSSLTGLEVELSAESRYFKSPLGFTVKYFLDKQVFENHKTTIVGACNEYLHFIHEHEKVGVQVVAMAKFEDVVLWQVFDDK